MKGGSGDGDTAKAGRLGADARPDEERWDSIPKTAREPFRIIRGEVEELHFRWELFKQVYEGDKGRLDLLHASAANFFHRLYFIMLDDLVLGICRLMDPPQGPGGAERLSLPLLVQRFRPIGPPTFVAKLDARLRAIRMAYEPLRQHRIMRIAHSDLGTQLSVGISGPPEYRRERIGLVLQKIGALMNDVEGRFYKSTLLYSAVVSDSDGDTLIYALKKAAAFDELVEEGVVGVARLHTGWRGDA